MMCSTPGHQGIKANWTVIEENVALVVCIQCAHVGQKMGARVRNLDTHGQKG